MVKINFRLTLPVAVCCIGLLFASCNKEDTPTLSGVPSITSALVGISPTEVEVSGMLLSDGGSPITEWGVCWSTKPVPTMADHNVTAPVKGNSFNVVLTGLEPASIYYLRSYMITANGTTYGNELSVVSKDQELTKEVVPDDVFRALLIARYDKNDDGILMVSEVSRLISLDVNRTEIASLEGIRYLYQLQELNCYSSKLTALDVSDLVNLKKLDCDNNLITTLDVSDCTELIRLYCSWNKLTAIEMSSCEKLEHLDCGHNHLTAIDVSNCKKLEAVNLDDNNLSMIDVSMLAELDEVSCDNNPLTSLNVSGCTKLDRIRVSTCKLTSLDVSSCVELRRFYCNNNLLTSLNVSACAKLEAFFCQENTNLSTILVSEQQYARKNAQGNIPEWGKPDQASYVPVDQILF